jgi:hypothetical protein
MKLILKLTLLLAIVASLDVALLRPHREWSEAERRNAAPGPQFNAVVERLARQEPTTHPAPINTPQSTTRNAQN